MISKNIFIYHLDVELQKLFELDKTYNYGTIKAYFSLVTRLGFLLSLESILVPASNYFESDMSFEILNSLKELTDIGYIKLISSSNNLEELLSRKAQQHEDNFSASNFHYVDFIQPDRRIILPGTLTRRSRSASEDIKTSWITFIQNEKIAKSMYKIIPKSDHLKLDTALAKLPEMLGDKAYISEYIVDKLPIQTENSRTANIIVNQFITREYIASFLREYDAACIVNIPLIDTDRILYERAKDISYVNIARLLRVKKYRKINSLDYVSQCSTYDLILYKDTNQWKEIIDGYLLEKNLVRSLETFKSGVNAMINSEVTIGIITAIPVEYAAMKTLITNSEEVYFTGRGAGHRFSIGKIKSANNRTHLIALAMCGMGNNSAALRASNLLAHFVNVETIFMVGIAGGIPNQNAPDNHVRLGDIVVSSEKGVVQYDLVKDSGTMRETRSNPRPPSAEILEAAQLMQAGVYEGVYPWRSYIDLACKTMNILRPPLDTDILHDGTGSVIDHPVDPSRDLYPKIHQGIIASSNTLLKNLEKRNELRDVFGAKAVEMEGSGIADATWNSNVGYMVVRGICDYCDAFKNDMWHGYAAIVAAAYTRSLIESLPADT